MTYEIAKMWADILGGRAFRRRTHSGFDEVFVVARGETFGTITECFRAALKMHAPDVLECRKLTHHYSDELELEIVAK